MLKEKGSGCKTAPSKAGWRGVCLNTLPKSWQPFLSREQQEPSLCPSTLTLLEWQGSASNFPTLWTNHVPKPSFQKLLEV